MALFVVNTPADVVNENDGAVSLREALLVANANNEVDTITFADSLAGLTIVLTDTSVTDRTTDLDINSRVVIDGDLNGDGVADITIDGNGTDRVFDIDEGDAGTAGTLARLFDLVITGGATTGDFEDGGGIRVQNGATAFIISSKISGNSTSGNFAEGGGLAVSDGDVTLVNSTVSGNSTNGNVAKGGGLAIEGGAVTLTNSTVSVNSTGGGNSDGGGLFTSDGLVTLTDSTISNNGTGGRDAQGGGLFTESGAVTLTDSTISNNITGGDIAQGGGLFTESGAVTLTGSTVSGNRTLGGNAVGGGLSSLSGDVTLTNSTVHGNSTNGNFGGGLFTQDGAVTLASSTVSGNVVRGNIFNSGSNGLGGGLWSNAAAVNVTDSILVGNAADVGGDFASAGAVSDSNSLFGDVAGFTPDASSQAGVTPAQVFASGVIIPGTAVVGGRLADNGGPTQTVALLDDPGNPALDALIGVEGIPAVDQRGVERPQGDGFDIGSFELEPGLLGGPPPQFLTGTDGPDTLSVDPDREGVVAGLGGDDLLTGNNLPDALDGGPGNDTINGAGGGDLLVGGGGDRDLFLVGLGDDVIGDFDVDGGGEQSADTLLLPFRDGYELLTTTADFLDFTARIESDGDGGTDATVDGADLVFSFGAGSVRLAGVVGGDGLTLDALLGAGADLPLVA